MIPPRYASVLGLGFGDCGKGLFVDALTRRWQARTIVRFNGGAQAGHNVITPARPSSISRHHTFSQFGAGTFVPGVRTLLIDPMIVHPTALLVEAGILGEIGVTDALSRLTIDAQCRITTPFHQAAGRLREYLRGAAAHGTCGVGVGETVRYALQYPGQELRYGDLAQLDTRMLLDQLQAIRESLRAELLPRFSEQGSSPLHAELDILQDESVAANWLATARAMARHCPPATFETVRRELAPNGCVLFEGAQGVLLDEWRGFHPHTTWSSINTTAADAVAARFDLETKIEHYGVMRTYLTRHGAGPLPTHDKTLDLSIREPHNRTDGWQGQFRVGHPDAVLLRYALEAAGQLSGLLISHLDIFRRGYSLRWCESYSITPSLLNWPSNVERLPLAIRPDLNHQCSLTVLLKNAKPQYSPSPIRSAQDFLKRLSDVTSLPVAFCSYGPTCDDV